MKLDPLVKKEIFIGYSDTSKAYRVHISGFKKIEISRNVPSMRIQPSTNRGRSTPTKHMKLRNLKLPDLETL